MDWKKIAPCNWFKEEEATPASTSQTLVRLNRYADPFPSLRTELERLFDDGLRHTSPGLPSDAPTWSRPAVDVSEGRKAYTVRAELPGIERKDISVEVQGQSLVIRGEKRHDKDEEHEGYHCIESSYGAVQRVLSLPDDADGEAIEAKFKNGVLKLRVPKHAARASNSRSIEIQSD